MFNFFSKKSVWLPVLILVAVGGFIYSFNLNNKLFWDDDDWIINNNFVHTISWDNIKFWLTHNTLAGVGLKSNYYRPFLFFTFAFNYIIAGVQPFFWHLTSNIIHIANAVLVFFLLRKFLTSDVQRLDSEVQPQKSPRLNLGTLTAFLTALIFVVHPLQTEAITYISGRGDSLAVFFMLLALIFFLKSKGSTLILKKVEPWGLGIWKLFSLCSLVLAILSRENSIIFPFLLMIFYMAFLSNQGSTFLGIQGRTFLNSLKKAFKEAFPYFGLVLIYGILRLTVLNFQNTLNFYATPNLYSENLSYRLFTFMHVLIDYFRLLFVPLGLHMERSMAMHTSLSQWPVWLGALIIFGIVAVGVWLYRRSKFMTSDAQGTSDVKVWLFGWGWFFVALSPVSGVTPINALIYEHWLYLPMVGFWFIVSFYLVKLFDYFHQSSQGSTFLGIQGRTLVLTLMIAGLVAYLSFFGYQAIKRNILWGKPVEFYKDILKHEPQSARISNNLGNLYFNQKDGEKAEFYYRQAVELGDDFPQPYFNLGSILQSKGDIFGAVKLYERAIEINSNFYYPYQNLAVIYAQQGNLVKARENIEILKSLLPTNQRVFYNSALIYISLNDKQQALEDLQTGLKYADLDPETGLLIEEFIQKLQK